MAIKTLTIAAKEIKSYFVTPLAYVVIAGFLVMSGFFFFSLLQDFNSLLRQASMARDTAGSLNEFVVTPYYQSLEIILIFLIPILTMRSFSEEKRSGTFELLLTAPVSNQELVFGKFLGIGSVIFMMLLTGFMFPLSLILFTHIETPPVLVGFLGVSLFAMSCATIGIGISACTKNQTVSGVVSLVTLLILYIIDSFTSKLNGLIGHVLSYITPASHTEAFISGVINGSDLVYMLSLMLVGLFIANRALDATRWR